VPEGPGSQPKISRVIVEQAGQHRVRDVTAYDLVAESAGIVFAESLQPAVMVEAAGRNLRLGSVACQSKLSSNAMWHFSAVVSGL
jgi:hypothetical protein